MADTSERLFFILPGSSGAQTASAATMGSKAYGLLRLARLGLPVPPAFVLGTAVCRDYLARGGRLPDDLHDLVEVGLARLEEATGQRYGAARRPLLVSVRSGAPASMPGMMETLLNVGLTEDTLHGLQRATGNPRQARDCYRRLVRDFMEVVHGAAAAPFDEVAARHCAAEGVSSARELDSGTLARIGAESLEIAVSTSGRPFPQSPAQQLTQAVEAVFRSWESDKARRYRTMRRLDDATGTAVTVQAMVFGNSGARSGAGVGFTRDPATGEKGLYLDFLFNAQGEDIVAGRHAVEETEHLSRRLPHVAAELERIKDVLEAEFRDMQDFEFTVENGRLYLLQTRNGQRTPWAALRIAVEMAREGVIPPAEALAQLKGVKIDRIERTRLAVDSTTRPLASAVSAGIGVAAGAIVFDSKRAAALAGQGQRVVLVRPDLETADIEGITAAEGVLTTLGGRTSHAAVVARQLGKVCLVGCREMRVAADAKSCTIGEARLSEGDLVTLDGDAGRVYPGDLPIVRERPERELAELERLASAISAASGVTRASICARTGAESGAPSSNEAPSIA